jgi:hypothetical protein
MLQNGFALVKLKSKSTDLSLLLKTLGSLGDSMGLVGLMLDPRDLAMRIEEEIIFESNNNSILHTRRLSQLNRKSTF